MSQKLSNIHYCYILSNKYLPHANRTYNGYTNNLSKRIRQHNGEIVGGAKYTKKYGNKQWNYLAIISGYPDYHNALQSEWRIKHPSGKPGRRLSCYNSPIGRLTGLAQVMCLERWTKQSIHNNSSAIFTIYTLPCYFHLFVSIPKNVTVKDIQQFIQNEYNENNDEMNNDTINEIGEICNNNNL